MLTTETGNAHLSGPGEGPDGVPRNAAANVPDDRPVEYWPTTAIRSALETGDISVWQRIVVAIKRDPFGRTARQVEEVLENAPPQGITNALAEVLIRSRQHLEATERAEAARHIRSLVARSGLSQQEFASRIGVPTEDLVLYLEGRVSPPASLVIRIRRLSDRFARTRTHHQRKSI